VKEKDVEARCDRIMAALGYTAIRFSQPRNTMQTPGIPDRRYYPLAWRGWPAFWFECKRPGGKQSPHQRTFQALVQSCGEDYVMGGEDELLEYLKSRGVIRDFTPVGGILTQPESSRA
jgi:hypothetical protein